MGYTILVTGASGYLGSAISVALSCDHRIIGLYRRPPSEKLKKDAPGIQWEKGEVADRDCMDRIFRGCAKRGQPVDYVIHFAAYTGFGKKWEDEYQTTNVIGTRNIVAAACDAGVKRILFAGSIAALSPLPMGQALTEKSPAGGDVAYSKSKALGEQILFENSHRIPVVVLRIGGVFTDWCELPPLFSVMTLWSKPFIGRMMPGQGLSGFPYIHRRDVVGIVKKIIEKNQNLARFETLFASPDGCTFQKELFSIIRRECSKTFSITPVPVPRPLARMALHGKYLLNTLRKRKTYERAWMIDYVDLPLIVDTTYTREKLNWDPSPGLHILDRLPMMLHLFNRHPHAWHTRNINRNDQKYDYAPD